MMTIDRNKPVMLTGGTGYLASWIVKMLLDDGINVHATVRDPNDEVKVGHLRSIAEKSGANLKLFQANLLEPGSFDEATKDCELIIHTASPFSITNVNNPEQELIRPAKEGTYKRIGIRKSFFHGQAGSAHQQRSLDLWR